MFGLFRKKMDVEAFIAGAREGLRLATEAHDATWHLGRAENWNVDQDQGRLVFTFADGVVATAPVQIVGTYSAADNTFMWGWEHPSVRAPLQEDARRVRAFAAEHDVAELKSHAVDCTEQRAWDYTALAMRLAEANGGYRGEASPGTYVFMTFGEVRLARS